MKVFISYSQKNIDFAERIANSLKENKIKVWIYSQSIDVGDDLTKVINSALAEIDYFIIILSKDSVKSDWVNFELNATLVNEARLGKKMVIPILYEDCPIPTSIRNRFYLDFRNEFDKPFTKLIDSLKKKPKRSKFVDFQKENPNNYKRQLAELKNAYANGKLSLFCGAGISFDAGIPTWNNLLKSMLEEVYLHNPNVEIDNIDEKLAYIFQNRINLSPLIIGKYLKLLLKDSFLEATRKILYLHCNDKSSIIDAIAELSRPRRGKQTLDSIITFNFDDLLERKFENEKIKFKSIHKEGQRVALDEIPIYHPHGYLPRVDEENETYSIVFSEDAYHAQFSESFTWSNIVQLNQLSSNTCLFIGISLTDPNMRRIIDVIATKSGQDNRNHFIIKKKYENKELFETPEGSQEEAAIIQMIEGIEETDANKLGFDVIWIDKYEEIPKILLEIDK